MAKTKTKPNGRAVMDITGYRSGRLVAVSLAPTPSTARSGAFWNCRCDCGAEKVIRAQHLRSVRPTRSCGCLKLDHINAVNARKASMRKNFGEPQPARIVMRDSRLEILAEPRLDCVAA